MLRFIYGSPAAIVLGLLLLAATYRCTHSDEPQEDSIDRDYRAELPRISPTEPQDALKTFSVAPGFRIEQVAAEPLVTDPIAMAFDENSRLFVVEMIDYSENDQDYSGRIRRLEDRNGDGRFDESTIFVDHLSWPTAVICYDGGIFVGAAPDIRYFKDTDGDGKADLQQVVFTGFDRSNVQGLLNSFQWGLDNRIHGATSSSGARIEIRSQTSEVRSRGAEPLTLRGRDFAFDPRTLAIEATSGGGQHGLSFDPWGNKFVCSNSNHLQWVQFEDRYVARNPYLAAPSPCVSIAADGPQAEVFRTSPVEPWRILRTRLRVKGLVPGPVEGGGRAAGYFSGATGVTIYRGHAWPDKYYGWAIIGDVGSNLVHRKRLEAQGVGFLARRVDDQAEFVSSSDIWFRPVQFANAPDGTLYVADMYREVIEHPKSLHPVIKQHLDLTSGRDRGRIYRLVPKGFQQPTLPRLSEASTAELVNLLDHKNGWHRETVARLLYERQDRRAVPLLEKLAAEAKLPESRIAALYALDVLQALTAEVTLARLADDHARVREHAVRLSEGEPSESAAVREKLFTMVNDADLRVKYQLAFTLGELSGPQRTRSLAKLLLGAPQDKSIRLAVRSSLARDSGDVLAVLAADDGYRRSAAGRQTMGEIAAQIGKQQRAEDVAAVLSLLRSLPPDEPATTQAIVQSLAAKPGSRLQKQIAAATGGRADELTRELVEAALSRAIDSRLESAVRSAAIHQLQLGQFEKLAPTLAQLLEPYEPTDIQSATLDTLAKFESASVAEMLLARWSDFSPAMRRQAGDVLFSRPNWTLQLLADVAQKKIKLSDLDPARLQILASHSEPSIRSLVATVARDRKDVSGRADVVRDYEHVLQLEGDKTRGKLAFEQTCAACHKLAGVGHEIGPDLATMKNRGAEAILLNVLDPNRELNPQYVSYVVVTQDGRSLSGMIAAETATSLTLLRADNKSDTVLRIDIDEMHGTGLSLMPEGMEKQIDHQTMADLISYLMAVE